MREFVYRDGRVRQVDLADCAEWELTAGRLRHVTGRYFDVMCIEDARGKEHLFIDQPEIGTLAFLYRERDGRREWLLQDKAEPGNVGGFQWAPTIQATRSNYERVHGGAATAFLEELARADAVVDVEQSEQGSQFLGKFNRNVKARISAERQVQGEHFRWVDGACLRALLATAFTVNTDARSVLASGAWQLLAEPGRRLFEGGNLSHDLREACVRSMQSLDAARLAEVEHLLADARAQCREDFRPLPLDAMRQLTLTAHGVHDLDRIAALGFFKVHLPSREVSDWSQPLLMRQTTEVYALGLRMRAGIAEVRAIPYPEPGFCGRVELGPTWQTGKGRWKSTEAEAHAALAAGTPLAKVHQSDEGGRFFQQRGCYSLVLDHAGALDADTRPGVWLSLAELEALSGMRGRVTNELRSLISLLLAHG